MKSIAHILLYFELMLDFQNFGHVQSSRDTNYEAWRLKMSAINSGYFKDPYAKFFVQEPNNRGLY